MKRIFVAAAALCALCGLASAQDADSADDYVLQKAREEYAASSGSGDQAATDQDAVMEQSTVIAVPQAPATKTVTTDGDGQSTVITIHIAEDKPSAETDDDERRRRYTPAVIGFVPGLSLPFGVYDTSLSLASVGALTGDVYGFQGSGVFNIADDVGIVQAAGVFNIADSVAGFQGAGVFNIADSIAGFQSAGMFNIADSANGVQAAGLFNIADEIRGVQVAGVVNVADRASGLMIGLVNIADELDGVAIGLVNIIGNGIHDLSVDYQFSTGMAYATYRSGTPFIYAAFSAGQPATEFMRTPIGLSTGVALGHRFRILFLTADVELGVETPIETADLALAMRALSNADPSRPETLLPLASAFSPFGSLRASFGFGNRKGFGPYAGIKADFAPSASGAVPTALRSAFGSAEPYIVPAFGVDLLVWPKWFIGIKF
ncbi:MAG TPA: hypothetical protein PLQ29_00710 [Spirochaetales bacterium]|nr:hypothetical protein [Spirochaetales bacterium]HPG85191.1 hypothetical protein [Spirochaetales bacterium]HPM71555.1 hypothetical protein [Spirochaetales bacterium]